MVSSPPTFFATALGILGLLVSGVSGISTVIGALTKVDAVVAVLSGPVTIFGYSLWGAAAFVSMILVALVTAILIIVWAWQSYSALCGVPAAGKAECVTGVINTVQGAFSYWYSQVVGFSNNQPRIDVVVKSIYWPTISLNTPSFVWCAPCTNCPPALTAPFGADAPCSPMLPCYYHNAQVCNAALGSAAGATAGAIAGGVVGVIAGVAAFGALGCSFTAIFSWICLIILLVILVIIIIIVAIVAAVGSAIGTQAGKAAAGGSSVPTGGASGAPLVPGAYVTVVGNMVKAQQALGANVLWFTGWIPNVNGATVDDLTAINGNGTTVLGVSVSGVPPFCFTDPDTNIPAALDVCPVPAPP